MVLGTAASITLRELRNANSWAPPRTYRIRNSEGGAQQTGDSDARSNVKTSGLGDSSYKASMGQQMHSWRHGILLRE